MIGLISGDIIASPFNKVPADDYSSIFFPIFTTIERISVDVEKKRATTRSYEPQMTLQSRLALISADWYIHSDSIVPSGKFFRDLLEENDIKAVSSHQLLAVCGPLVELSSSEAEARMLVSNIFSEMKSSEEVINTADVLTEYMWRTKKDGRMTAEQTERFLTERDFPFVRSASEMRPVMDGMLTYDAEKHIYTYGDGKRSKDVHDYVSAAIVAFMEGESFEGCVRRAAALGGDASVTASITGALAEMSFPVPETISYRANDYLSAEDLQIMNSFTRIINSELNSIGPSIEDLNGPRVSVMHMKGLVPIYGIDDPSEEMLAAIENAQSVSGSGYRIVSVKEFDSIYKSLLKQQDRNGVNLEKSVYIQDALPSVRMLWLQDGHLRSSVTRDGVRLLNSSLPLPSKVKRQRIFSEFQLFKQDVNSIRKELESYVHYDAEEYGGRHLSFPSARYPVVYDNHVDVFENGICRGRCGLSEDGLFYIDPNAVGYTFQGEGIEGVLNSRSFFPKNGNMKECLQALRFLVLDDGIVPDEEERKHLELNDDEAYAIRKKYGSNLDKALSDIGVFFTEKEFFEEVKKFDHRFGFDSGKTRKKGLEAFFLASMPKDGSGKPYLDDSSVKQICDSFVKTSKIFRDPESPSRKELDSLSVSKLLPEVTADASIMSEYSVSDKVVESREERRKESEETYKSKGINDFETLIDSQTHIGSVFTIGCSNTSVEDFISTLKRFGIEVICDIREKRNSRYNPDFNESRIEDALNEAGIGYEVFGGLSIDGHGIFPGYEMAPGGKALTSNVRSAFCNELDRLRHSLKDGVRFALMSGDATIENSRRFLVVGRALAHPEETHSKQMAAEAEKCEVLIEAIANADKRNWNRKAAALRAELKEFKENMIEPKDVQHITPKGYPLSQQFFESKLRDAYSVELNGEGITDDKILPESYARRQKSVLEKKTKQHVTARRLNRRKNGRSK